MVEAKLDIHKYQHYPIFQYNVHSCSSLKPSAEPRNPDLAVVSLKPELRGEFSDV